MSTVDSLRLPVPPLRIVDVGASLVPGAKTAQDILFPRFPGQLIGFEPIAEECAKLNRQARPWERFHPRLLGDGRPRTLHITRDTYSSSVYEPDGEMIGLFQAYGEMLEVVRKVELPSVRLDDVEDLKSGADLLKLDTQGSELDILTHAPKLLQSVLVIITEAWMVPFYKHQPLFADLDALLRASGFHLHKFMFFGGQKLRPFAIGKFGDQTPFSQLLWVDCVYIRQLTSIPRLADEQLLKLGLIMRECFGAVDVTHYCLAQYDRRKGTDLAKRFARAAGIALPEG